MFTKVISAAFIAVPFFAQSVLAADCTRSYTVQEGDICDGISAANKVSTYQLAVVNNDIIDSTCSNLQPGQTICLGHAGEDCSTTYTVVADDTCEGIASKAGINSTILYMNNPQINEDCTNIYIGEVLCTASTVQVPPVPANGKPATTIPTTALPANPSATAPHVDSTPAPAPTPTPSPSNSETGSGHNDSGEDDPEDADDDEGDDDEDDEGIPFCDEL